MSTSLSFQPLPQPWMLQGAARHVYDALTAEGDEARFVGGCVRDALLGRKINDIDIATPLPPGKVIELLTSAGIKNIPTGIEHGTVTAVVNSEPIEVTTLRRDVETFGRQARVAFTDDWQADAARRDLTMNALSCRLDGRVHDYFGGLDDLTAGRVRFVGDPRTRMKEDYLRVLRFFRFHANYAAGEPDPAAMAAAKASASQLAHLSGERLRQETLKLLAAGRGPETWGHMLEAGIVSAYLPEATDQARLVLVAQREAALRIAPAAIRRLAALLPGKTEALAVGTRLRLSRREQERLSGIAAGPEIMLELEPVAVRRLVYRHGNDLALDLLLVHAEDDADLVQVAAIAESWHAPRMPVGGKDLAELGLQPGAAMGRWLALAEAWWIAGDFRADRAACMSWLKAQLTTG
ncbi:CCA tRNA nucleotidyltransferase [Dongia soli]|uniref:CCA tRNA nucleotidyltransferase n=1 Tax=Dongia soli TaxID=600628 RepID=A0ABU5EEE8_9PROT|nr:CCA tRNA nucleotidyltransferase [Dongia soli]MDY0883910.1 CCA tRNA nucleotidyltransferase [Dongia soli]